MVLVSKRKSNKKKVLLLMTAILLVAVGAFYFLRVSRDRNSSATTSSGNPDDTSIINYDEATEAEKQEAEDNKDKLDQQNNGSSGNVPTTTDGRKSATVSIVDASQYGQDIEVSISVAGVIESGGTCKATFTKDGNTVSGTSTSEDNVSNTVCSVIAFKRSEFPTSGTWSLKVTYESSRAQGEAVKSVDIN